MPQHYTTQTPPRPCGRLHAAHAAPMASAEHRLADRSPRLRARTRATPQQPHPLLPAAAAGTPRQPCPPISACPRGHFLISNISIASIRKAAGRPSHPSAAAGEESQPARGPMLPPPALPCCSPVRPDATLVLHHHGDEKFTDAWKPPWPTEMWPPVHAASPALPDLAHIFFLSLPSRAIDRASGNRSFSPTRALGQQIA